MSENNVCPSCGYCPHCKRGGQWTYPMYPYPTWVGPTWIRGTTTITTGTVATGGTVTNAGKWPMTYTGIVNYE